MDGGRSPVGAGSGAGGAREQGYAGMWLALPRGRPSPVTSPVCAGDASKIDPPLSVPMRAKPSQRTHCDFSFAGLKAAVKRRVQADAPLSEATRANLAAAFQQAAISHIVDRLDRGLRWCQPSSGAAWAAPVAPRCLVVSGGVGSNAALRAACVALVFCFDCESCGQLAPVG